jgi:hypothetical protein
MGAASERNRASLISDIFTSIGVAIARDGIRLDLGTKQEKSNEDKRSIKSVFMGSCLTSVVKSNTNCAKSPIFVTE